MIWLASLPRTATVEFNETEFDVTSISPPTPLLLTCKEAHATALSFLSPTAYPIWGPEDWEMLSLDPEKMILQIIINPSKSASLNITWTDIWSVLGDALLAASRLHIVCCQPERLARLFMLEEAEWLGVGQACNEEGLFMNAETVSDERKARESLQAQLTVTVSKHTVEEIDEGISGDEVSVWKLIDERILTGFGHTAKVFSTKAFSSVGAADASRVSVFQLHRAARAFALPAEEAVAEEELENEEEEGGRSGVELTEDTMARYLEECQRLWPPRPQDPSWDEEGSIAPAKNETVIKWLA